MREQILKKSALLGEEYYQIRHECGLTVCVFPKKLSVTHAVFAVFYGAADNVADAHGKKPFPDGIAHFLEHKLFTNEDGSDSFERFSALGADANAYTSHTKTAYLFSATENVMESLAELARFVTRPYFTKESVEKEQGIIGEEIRMCRDNPYDVCYYNMLKGLYREHPVRDEICGSIASIAKISDRTLYDCYRRYYTPDNMFFAVCGDVSPDDVMRVLDENLSPEWQESRSGEATSSALLGDTCVHKKRVVTKGQVAKPIFSIGVKDVALPTGARERTRRGLVLSILSEMLFSESGELYSRLLDAGMISPDFSADYGLSKTFGFLQISGEASDPDAVLDAVMTYLDEVREKGLSKEDFERERRVELAEYIKSFDSTEEIATALLSCGIDGEELFDTPDVIGSLSFDEVTAALEEFFLPEHITISIVMPQSKE